MHLPRLAVACTLLAAFVSIPAIGAQDRECMAGLTAQAEASGGITITWTPPNATEAAGITGYQVLFRAPGAEWFPVQPQSPPSANSYTDHGAAEGTPYEYAVVAMKGDAQYATYCSVTATATATLEITDVTPQRNTEAPFVPSSIALMAGGAGVLGATVMMLRKKR